MEWQDGNKFDEQVLRSSTPTVVMFSASWCYACRNMEPELTAVTDAIGAKAVKFDVVKGLEVAERFQIKSIPTVVVIKDGTEVERIVGACRKDKLEKCIRRVM